MIAFRYRDDSLARSECRPGFGEYGRGRAFGTALRVNQYPNPQSGDGGPEGRQCHQDSIERHFRHYCSRSVCPRYRHRRRVDRRHGTGLYHEPPRHRRPCADRRSKTGERTSPRKVRGCAGQLRPGGWLSGSGTATVPKRFGLVCQTMRLERAAEDWARTLSLPSNAGTLSAFTARLAGKHSPSKRETTSTLFR